jgi:hypothetical protein
VNEVGSDVLNGIKMLNAIVKVLKKRFNNLTVEEALDLATQISQAIVEATE